MKCKKLEGEVTKEYKVYIMPNRVPFKKESLRLRKSKNGYIDGL